MILKNNNIEPNKQTMTITMKDDTTNTNHDTATTTSINNINYNNNDSFDDLHHQNDQMIDEIELETKKQPLTSELKSLSEYCSIQSSTTTSTDTNNNKNKNNNNNNNVYYNSIQSLIYDKNYISYRIVRGDGNCFYRAFLYILMENINSHTNVNETKRIYDWLKVESYQEVLNIGQYNEMTIEIFYETMIEVYEKQMNHSTLNNNDNNNLTIFHNDMNIENDISDYCTWYLRILTATYIKKHADRFLPFILNSENINGSYYNDINQYCLQEIEPMTKECEEIHVIALAEYFNVIIQIEYVDGRFNNNDNTTSSTPSSVTHHIYGNTTPDTTTTTTSSSTDDVSEMDTTSASSTITEERKPFHFYFLYRPGHYDILYIK